MSQGLTSGSLPTALPATLQVLPMRITCWRIEATAPAHWSWTPFPQARYRFDSAAGTTRVRYAGLTQRGAARERWNPDRTISAVDADSWVVQLRGTVNVVDLRHEQTLDALHLDDRINTSRDPVTWATCQQLGDRLRGWLGTDFDGIVYRSRTTPQTSANVAWHNPAALDVVSSTRLRDAGPLLDSLVLGDSFTVNFSW